MTISPTSDSESSPHAPGVSTFTPHSPFAPPFSETTDPHKSVDLGVTSDMTLSSSPASAPHYMIPAITQSSLASPAFPIDQVTAAPIPLLSSNGPNDGTVGDPPDSDLRYNVDESQELAMSAPEMVTDILGHPLDTASVSRDIDLPE
ncbi:hypothetical protein BGW80DRAFT_1333085 [Lactifluus volemus]|nr:hypothetical protein BGW80DRAFT_1333085 [Lactifluus volemus]